MNDGGNDESSFSERAKEFAKIQASDMLRGSSVPSLMVKQLRNLAPSLFPITFGDDSGDRCSDESNIVDAVSFMRTTSMEMLSLHDRSIPSCLRDMYKRFLFAEEPQRCRAMSIVFNMMHQSRIRLSFYKDIAQLASGVLTSRVPKMLPLDRGIRCMNVTIHDVFNDMNYRNKYPSNSSINGDDTSENPYVRMLRNIILEALREFAENTDGRLFKENVEYDNADIDLISRFVDKRKASTVVGTNAPADLSNFNDDVKDDNVRHDVPIANVERTVVNSERANANVDEPVNSERATNANVDELVNSERTDLEIDAENSIVVNDTGNVIVDNTIERISNDTIERIEESSSSRSSEEQHGSDERIEEALEENGGDRYSRKRKRRRFDDAKQRKRRGVSSDTGTDGEFDHATSREWLSLAREPNRRSLLHETERSIAESPWTGDRRFHDSDGEANDQPLGPATIESSDEY